jgi:transcription elongation factor Elf1
MTNNLSIKNRPHPKSKMVIETSFECPVCHTEVANRIRNRDNFIEPEYIICYRCKYKSLYVQLDSYKYKALPIQNTKWNK